MLTVVSAGRLRMANDDGGDDGDNVLVLPSSVAEVAGDHNGRCAFNRRNR